MRIITGYDNHWALINHRYCLLAAMHWNIDKTSTIFRTTTIETIRDLMLAGF